MRKALIIILLIAESGCTVTRYTKSDFDNRSRTPGEILKGIQKNNLSEESYFIEKGSIILNMNEEKQRLLFSIKFQKPQNYLISVRNYAGMEGARIFVAEDTLLINDRINRRILFGEPEDIERIAGFKAEMINTLFGDFLPGVKDSSVLQPEMMTNNSFMQYIEGEAIKSVINSKIDKILSVNISNTKTSNSEDSFIINYSKFNRKGKHIPGNIEVRNIGRNISAKIKIEKLTVPWDGVIEFVPGKGFKSERIK